MGTVYRIDASKDRGGEARYFVTEMENLISHRKATWSSYEGSVTSRKDQEWLDTLKNYAGRFEVKAPGKKR